MAKLKEISQEERMLHKVGSDTTEILKKILGDKIRVELTVYDAPGSKIAIITEGNPDAKGFAYGLAKLDGEGYKIKVADDTLPF